MSASSQPLIPEQYLDAPSQRLYYLSLGLLCQAIKLIDVLWHWTSGSDDLGACRKWIIVDFLYILSLRQLRIPRLTYSRSVVALQIIILWFLDSILFGGITIHVPFSIDIGKRSFVQHEFATPESINVLGIIAPFMLGLISSGTGDSHLLGQHTVRMSPISTARLNPYGSIFCLKDQQDTVLIPVLLNNTSIAGLKYSNTPLDFIEGKSSKRIEYIDLSAKDLNAIEQVRLEGLQVARHATVPAPGSDDYDDYDDDEDDEKSKQAQATLQNSQSLVHIRVSKPGIIRLARVSDSSNNEARLVMPSEAVVAPCPRAKFVDDGWKDTNVRCAGQEKDVQLLINVFGVPPLSLQWLKIVNSKREHFLVEGIKGGNGPTLPTRAQEEKMAWGNVEVDQAATPMLPHELKVPLTVPLDTIGTYTYALEEVTDGIGNTITVKPEAERINGRLTNQTTTTRSMVVLRRPSMSFKSCGPERPTSLLIGSEANLVVAGKDADEFDAPWEVEVAYQPRADDDDKKKSKALKPWKKTFKSSTSGRSRELTVPASSPGDYTLLSVKGKYCSGDILAPETCRVIQKPLPSAEIQWKRIHECSGDTGVLATLVLRGAPPFQVYYRMQRDDEPPRELVKTFASARGEMTLQPDRSGHYTFKFVQLSDANYKKVELKGPSIEQVVHPPATADFANNQREYGGKRAISSCSGSIVDVDVDLKGTGPWSLEAQVIGPKTSDTLSFENIEAPRKTLHIPIPKEVDKDGGSFEINLLSIEDAYGCKRSISVPGISVDVRRIKPTAKFYGTAHDRRVTVLEHEKAEFPLRLTGHGPWRVKYEHADTGKILVGIVTNPNGNLQVTDRGVYKLLEVSDSKCPGSIIASESTYTVDWVPKPLARLAAGIEAAYEPYNGSHILPPICEGTDAHVDLELTGRPPFQITYNIARGADNGGTHVLDQPTFNSIQPRTRIQLQTSTPGRIYYEVKQIGDAAYPLSKHKNVIIPRSERLLFEQQVFQRSSARFKNRRRLTYCLNDVFVEPGSTDGMIIFDGNPPFKLELSIKDISASQTELRSIEVFSHAWNLNLPSHTFKSIGPHLVTIESVVDSSNCAQAALDPLHSSIWVDVAENAAVIPFERREDYCVGEATQFQLEGIPPWSITYRINEKTYTQEVHVSPFSLLQQQAGEFAITSIAHQQKMCRVSVTDLHLHIHPLPSAHVGSGKRIHEHIHEGDQAGINFTLIGEPPFTFTYQRSEASPKKGSKPGRVLETHTVSRVMTHGYSIFSALEGTWTVTSITDRYCRYPPPTPDRTLEKH